MRLAEELESLLEKGPQNSRFDVELSSVIRELNQEWGRTPEEIRTEIRDSETEHPLIRFLVGLSRWVETRDYHAGAEPALRDLREAIDHAIEEDWNDLFSTLIVQRVELLGDLNYGSELAAEVRLGICFLIEMEKSIAIGRVFSILDAITDNLVSISGTPAIETLIEYLNDHAGRAMAAGDYKNHRDLCRRNLVIREAEALNPQPARDAIINSYDREIESLRSDEEHSLRAITAREAIEECNGWVNETRRVEWEREFIDGNKMSIEQMAGYSHEPSEKEIKELDEEVEDIIDRFREQKEEKHAIFAIKWLVNHSIFVPDVGKAREISEGSIMDLVQRRTVSQAGESYSQNEGAVDLPQSYGPMVQLTQNLRQDVYYRLQNRELIKMSDLFILFNRRDVLSADTHAYLTDFIINLFENNHSAAIHLGMTQLEAVIRTLAADNGKSVLSRDEETGELGRRPLGSLLYQMDEDVNESWISYLQYRYVDLAGQNVRNRIAHGYMPYSHASWGMSIILLFDILQIFLEFEEAY